MPQENRRTRRERARAAADVARADSELAPAPTSPRSRPTALPIGAALALGILALYLATAARDLVYGDSPELTGAAVTLGVAHAPGYPIWTMVAHAFTLVPIDTVSFRVSAFSALAGTGAVVIVYATALRLSASAVASAAAAALLGLTPVVWSWSIVPEVFALHALLVAALVGLLVLWHQSGRAWSLIAAAFVGGLGVAHQQTIVLVAPAALLLMWVHRDTVVRGGLLWKSALAFVAGLLPYAYLPVAAAGRPAWNYGDISSAGDLAAQILRTDLGSGQLVSDRAFQGGSALDRLVFYAQSFDVASAALVLLGALVLYRRDRVLFWTAAVAAAITGPAFVLYANVDINAVPVLRTVLERFFISSHVVLAPIAALGLVWLGEQLAPGARSQTTAGAGAVAVVFGLVLAGTAFARIDQRENHDARHFAEDFLASVPKDKILLASGDAIIWPIGYLHRIEGARPDVTLLEAPLLTFSWYVRQASREHPDLVLRAAKYDGHVATSRDLIEPNGVERFELAGGLLDDSMNAAYTFARRGLVVDIRPKTAQLDADAVAAESDRLLRTYRIPRPEAVAGRNWDQLTLGDYAFVAFDVAQLYESRGSSAQARVWYMRALSILPDMTEARAALARLK
jgi:dolichyl-phosphate-mannose-protein mannosyltransferase